MAEKVLTEVIKANDFLEASDGFKHVISALANNYMSKQLWGKVTECDFLVNIGRTREEAEEMVRRELRCASRTAKGCLFPNFQGVNGQHPPDELIEKSSRYTMYLEKVLDDIDQEHWKVKRNEFDFRTKFLRSPNCGQHMGRNNDLVVCGGCKRKILRYDVTSRTCNVCNGYISQPRHPSNLTQLYGQLNKLANNLKELPPMYGCVLMARVKIE